MREIGPDMVISSKYVLTYALGMNIWRKKNSDSASASDLLCTGCRNFGNFLLENQSLGSKTLWHLWMLVQGLSVKKNSLDFVTWPWPLSFTSAWTAPYLKCWSVSIGWN